MSDTYWPDRPLDLNRELFGRRVVSLTGVGGLGSHIGEAIARIPVGGEIRVFDDDTLERGNHATQYDVEGCRAERPKVAAIAMRLEALGFPRDRIVQHQRRVTGHEDLGAVVFCVTDSLESRETAWLANRDNDDLEIWVDARTGPDGGRIYAFPAKDDDARALYESTFSMGAGEPCALSYPAAVGMAIAGLATSAFVRVFMGMNGDGPLPPTEGILIPSHLSLDTRSAAKPAGATTPATEDVPS